MCLKLIGVKKRLSISGKIPLIAVLLFPIGKRLITKDGLLDSNQDREYTRELKGLCVSTL